MPVRDAECMERPEAEPRTNDVGVSAPVWQGSPATNGLRDDARSSGRVVLLGPLSLSFLPLSTAGGE